MPTGQVLEVMPVAFGAAQGSWRHTTDRIWALGFFRSRGGFAAGQLRLLALPVRGTLDDQLVEIGGPALDLPAAQAVLAPLRSAPAPLA